MKLYEFTVTDEFNLPEDQVIKEVMQSLGDHPHSSDWVSGYQLKQCQSPEQLSNSTKRYFFEVWGDLVVVNSFGLQHRPGRKPGTI